jgi:Peptidase A4 family
MHKFMRRATGALASSAISVSALAAATPATASTTHPSIKTSPVTLTNWAGYYVEPSNGSLLAAVVNFTVPAVNCRDSRGKAPYYGSMWVGISVD